jgi:hypothetical protein
MESKILLMYLQESAICLYHEPFKYNPHLPILLLQIYVNVVSQPTTLHGPDCTVSQASRSQHESLAPWEHQNFDTSFKQTIMTN